MLGTDNDDALRKPMTTFWELVAAALRQVAAAVFCNHRSDLNSVLLELSRISDLVFNDWLAFREPSLATKTRTYSVNYSRSENDFNSRTGRGHRIDPARRWQAPHRSMMMPDAIRAAPPPDNDRV